VRLKQTVTKPAFLMPLTNPKFDVDVSAAMVNGGAVEMGLSQVRHAHDCGLPPTHVCHCRMFGLGAWIDVTYLRSYSTDATLSSTPLVTGLVLPVKGSVHQGRWQPRPGGGCGWQLWVVLPVCRRNGLQVEPLSPIQTCKLQTLCRRQTQAHSYSACEGAVLNA
jgi:hypothetical protein